METGEDFTSGWLPTLDTDIRISPQNIVDYKFYEKPMSSNMTVQKGSAMEENAKIKTLSNDLTRRLLNTSVRLGMEEKIKVIDAYSQKLLNAGFGLDQVRRIVTNGIKGFERIVAERGQETTPKFS